MNNIKLRCALTVLLCAVNLLAFCASHNIKVRRSSDVEVSYFIDPIRGNDKDDGLHRASAWKTFNRINKIVLKPDDRIYILSPGVFYESLCINGKGSDKKPIRVTFAPGQYEFYPDGAVKLPLHISNTNVKPYQPKSIALMMDSTSYISIEGKGACINIHGKMIETYISRSTNIRINGLSFNYYRPTVSELVVLDVQMNYADVRIHKDSKFQIRDSSFTWLGEGWSHQPVYLWQMLNPTTSVVSRLSIKLKGLSFAAITDNKVRIYFKQNPGFIKGNIYQNREIERDCAGFFIQHSKNIDLDNLNIHFMHGMGIVSQFSEDITISNLSVKPLESSGRTCAAWADILHFSGCKGQINIKNSYLSAANDDAINVHGTYLKIIDILGDKKLRLRFMHPETYGFNPFSPEDSIEIVNQSTLLPKVSNVVLESKLINDREVELTLRDKITTNGIIVNDYIENISATPQVIIQNNTFTRIPTRGILVTTRRKIVISKNLFNKTFMSAVLVSDDAKSWYESGKVKDLTITNNIFKFCGEPVIMISPETEDDSGAVIHENINISDNTFWLLGQKMIYAKNTANLRIQNNKIYIKNKVTDVNDLVELKHLENSFVDKNSIKNQFLIK